MSGAGIAMVKGLHMPVNTIGDLYTISNALPALTVPVFNFDMVQKLLPDAFTIAILAAIESLLSCVVADGMINSKHRSNTELVAQGAGNIVSALFGGIPATGAIARTAANIKYGSCSCTSVDSCCADALCGTYSDADDCSDFVYGSL